MAVRGTDALPTEQKPLQAGKRPFPLYSFDEFHLHTLRQACPRSNFVGDGPANVRPFHHRRGSSCHERIGDVRMLGSPMVKSGGAPASRSFLKSSRRFARSLSWRQLVSCLVDEVHFVTSPSQHELIVSISGLVSVVEDRRCESCCLDFTLNAHFCNLRVRGCRRRKAQKIKKTRQKLAS